MDIFHSLRQLHKIQPDADHALYSRTKILMEAPLELPWYRRVTRILGGVLESGSAIALTGVVLFLILGGFSIKFIGGGLNGDDLRAEAQAIDIQIQLADVQYQSLPNDAGARQMPPSTFKTAGVVTTATATTTTSTATGAGEEEVGVDEIIDDALLQLSVP